jgi:DNA topoisomerase-3
MRSGKQIRSTPAGRGLIHSLPDIASTPDMTARWETELDAISQRSGSYNAFMQPLLVSLHELIAQSQTALPEGLKNIDREPAPGKKRRPSKAARKKSATKASKQKARLRTEG